MVRLKLDKTSNALSIVFGPATRHRYYGSAMNVHAITYATDNGAPFFVRRIASIATQMTTLL